MGQAERLCDVKGREMDDRKEISAIDAMKRGGKLGARNGCIGRERRTTTS